jgi:hypothetical protein
LGWTNMSSRIPLPYLVLTAGCIASCIIFANIVYLRYRLTLCLGHWFIYFSSRSFLNAYNKVYSMLEIINSSNDTLTKKRKQKSKKQLKFPRPFGILESLSSPALRIYTFHVRSHTRYTYTRHTRYTYTRHTRYAYTTTYPQFLEY